MTMFDSAVSPAYLVLVILCTLLSLKVLARWTPPPALGTRYATIDGLRGYLALLVFAHHASFWYFASHGGPWYAPGSHLYVHLGESSVILFFMITGFLFFGRILNSGPQGPDWLQIAVGRVLRLAPLYGVAVALMLIGVMALAGWTLREPIGQFAAGVGHWLLFTINQAPALNGVKDPGRLLAGVVWSLPYEWFFYGCLPLLALATGRRPPVWALAVGLVAAACFLRSNPHTAYLLAFGCGMATAAILKRAGPWRLARSHGADVLIVGLLAGLVWHFPSGVGYAQVLLLGLVFFLITSGASLFGALLHPLSRLLGEMAYGIYLLHGLLLYATFVGPARQGGLTTQAHWALVLAVVPVLIGVCWLAHLWAEKPAMDAVGPLVARLRHRGQPRPQ